MKAWIFVLVCLLEMILRYMSKKTQNRLQEGYLIYHLSQ